MTVLVAIYSPAASWNIPDSHVDQLRRRFPHHRFHHARSEADVLHLIGAAEVAFMPELRARHLAAAPALRWVHSPAAGVGGMLFPAMRSASVIVTNSRGMSAGTIAEHVLALTLALFRKLPLAFSAQRERRWVQDDTMMPPPLRMIRGSRVLVVGLGGIGAACAKCFADLGARVDGVRKRADQPRPEGVTRVGRPEDLRQMLGDAEVIVLAAPQTGETRRLIGEHEFRSMRPDAILINVSRGKLVDEQALVRALAEERIAGAGLDVFEHEPLDAASPLWTLPNVVITPHVAGFRADHWDAATAIFAENLRRYDAGEPLRNVVDKQRGY